MSSDVRFEWWRSLAKCRGADNAPFYPERGDNFTPRKAKKLCYQCPVQTECLQWALDNCEYHGIWGGLTPRERREIRLGRRTL
jgi:WhiB family redox-sensing transcriptional regulator